MRFCSVTKRIMPPRSANPAASLTVRIGRFFKAASMASGRSAAGRLMNRMWPVLSSAPPWVRRTTEGPAPARSSTTACSHEPPQQMRAGREYDALAGRMLHKAHGQDTVGREPRVRDLADGAFLANLAPAPAEVRRQE